MVQKRRHISAGDSKTGILAKFIAATNKRTFQYSLIIVVADQLVGQTAGFQVHGSVYRHADILIGVAPEILYGGKDTGLKNFY